MHGVVGQSLWQKLKEKFWQKTGCGLVVSLFLIGLSLTGCQFPQTLPPSKGNAPPKAEVKLPSAKRLPSDTLMLALNTEPPSLDPMKISDAVSGTVMQQLMRGLTKFDDEGKVVPAVASHWKVDNQGKRYTFYLRKDARWSDGQPVTAQQFYDGWLRVLDKNSGAPYSFFFFPIVNAQAYFQGTLNDATKVGIRVLNTHTLQVDLVRPLVFFPSMIAYHMGLPIRKELIERHGDRFTEGGTLVSNGPYTLKTWRHDERLVLEPNPYYWQQRPNRPKLQFRIIPDAGTSVMLFENGELDVIESGSGISAFEFRRFATHPWAKQVGTQSIYYLGFNTKKPPFHHAGVRRAFCQALQKQWIPQLLQAGQTPLHSFVTPDLLGYDAALGLRYDAQAAKQAWKAAKVPAQQVQDIQIGVRNTYDSKRIGEIVRYQWQQTLGVPVRLKLADWKVYLNELERDPPHIFFLSWLSDYPDADSFLGLFTSNNGNNHTQWKHPRYDALVEEAQRITDPAKRKVLYKEVQQLAFEQEACACPLYQLNKLYVKQPRVQGLHYNPLNQLQLDAVSLVKP
ncbi:MAG: peptide ABC transporter substrate-binding protein [Vampirovibrionales bacterium]